MGAWRLANAVSPLDPIVAALPPTADRALALIGEIEYDSPRVARKENCCPP
jgi:hypothetical protein